VSRSTPPSAGRSPALTIGVFLLLAGARSAAQTGSVPQSAAGSPGQAVYARDADGRVVARASRVSERLSIDARLDEPVYAAVSPITEFVQQEPDEGAAVSERTEVWLLFDDVNVYITCRCWDEHPDRIVANDMRRDSNNIPQHDHLAVQFDTFHDRRNGFMFLVTPAGGIRDAENTDGRVNADWNAVWDGRATRFESGWIAEIAIPFKSLRYGPQDTWGVQIRRFLRAKNERAHLTRVSRALGGNAINRPVDAATLVGLDTPSSSRPVEIKPYAIARTTTDHVSRPALENEFDPDAGVDVKYAVTKSLTADFSYRTDFAQVEVDEAQVNLTRFNLSYPEKREFFLEGQGVFQFGLGPGGVGAGGGSAPMIFYSRRIGLAGSAVVPVIAGGRLTGKAGPWSVGALTMGTEAVPTPSVPQTNFTVFRARRDVLRRSTVGGIFTHRSVSTVAPGANDVWAADASFAFYDNVSFSGYAAQSRTEGREGDDFSYRTQFNYSPDRYGLVLDRIVVQPDFNPEVGFLQRRDFQRNYVQGRFSPRPMNSRRVRKYTYQGTVDYLTNNDQRLESREAGVDFRADFNSGDSFTAQYSEFYELLVDPFAIAPGVTIPPGGYDFGTAGTSYTAGPQHRLSGTSSLDIGEFYDGWKTTVSFRGRLEVTPQLGVEPNVSLNWVDLPGGAFTNTLVSGRATFTVTPRMFVAALVQYTSINTSLSTNLRFRWEYRPGSELFVVYSEGRSTLPVRWTALENRGLVVKVNRLFRF
jgi:hypothetical protein